MHNFKSFVDLVASIDNIVDLEDFLVSVTTPQERKALIQRVEIVKRLEAGVPQHKISKDLGVGIATVTRGSKELSQGRFKVLRKQYE